VLPGGTFETDRVVGGGADAVRPVLDMVHIDGAAMKRITYEVQSNEMYYQIRAKQRNVTLCQHIERFVWDMFTHDERLRVLQAAQKFAERDLPL
jgi:hypothetical protein